MDISKDFTPTLTATQQLAMDAALDHQSIIVAGRAGSGKSLWIRAFQKQSSGVVVLTATTGIASVNIGGMTIHRFSGVGMASAYGTQADRLYKLIRSGNDGLDIQALERDFVREAASTFAAKTRQFVKSVRRIKRTEVLVMDECSMLSRYMFEMLDCFFREIRNVDRPWGGLQVIFVGDMRQMPPVAPGTTSNDDIMADFFFSSPLFNELFGSRVFVFKEIFRQKNVRFQELLNRVADGMPSDEDIDIMRSRVCAPHQIPDDATRLYGTNADASAYNTKQLNSIISSTNVRKTFRMHSSVTENLGGTKREIEMLEKWCMDNCIADEVLDLAVGAYVMLIQNMDVELGLANGTCGHVVGFEEPSGFPQFVPIARREIYTNWKSNQDKIIRKRPLPNDDGNNNDNNQKFIKTGNETSLSASVPSETTDNTTQSPLTPAEIRAKRFDETGVIVAQIGMWEIIDYGVAKVAANQIPLKLAWAITKHKSQGQQLERTVTRVDRRNCFCDGQAYVGLSRQVDLEGLFLESFESSYIRASPKAVAFYKKFDI